MTRRGRRLTLIVGALSVVGIAVGLVSYALRDTIVFFYGPSELTEKALAPGTRARIGGLVKEGSVVRDGPRTIHFLVTDLRHDVRVTYTGALPDLFREGQGVVAEGVLTEPAVIAADTILAKHDETYMPREVADALKKQGVWNEDKRAANAVGARP